MSRSSVALVALLVASGCTGLVKEDAGTAGGACRQDGTCDAGLSCDEDNVCRQEDPNLNDPCDGVDCSGQGSCAVVQASAKCNCNNGYHDVGLTCVADDPGDPCADVTCSDHGTCQSSSGSATCDCNDGYHPDGLACVADELQNAVLTWEQPLLYMDDTTLDLSDLEGFKLHYGTASGSYTTTEDIHMPECTEVNAVLECTYTVLGLGSGHWYFVVSAYTSTAESAYSEQADKVIP